MKRLLILLFLVSLLLVGRTSGDGFISNQRKNPYIFIAASDATVTAKSVADVFCDGTADEVQIQAALDALPTTGGVVRLSEGTFTIAATILPTQDNWTLEGTSAGTVTVASARTVTSNTSSGTILKMVNSGETNVFKIDTGIVGWTLRDLVMDGNKANQSTGAAILYIDGGAQDHKHALIEHCFIQNGKTVGIYSDYGRRIRLVDSFVLNNDSHGIHIVIGHIEMFDVSVAYNGGDGMMVDAMQDFIISGCSFSYNTDDGIELLNKAMVADCFFFDNGDKGITTITDSSLTNCIFDGNDDQQTIGAATDARIVACRFKNGYLDNLVNCEVIGCEIKDGADCVRACDESSFVGNQMHDNEGHGISGPANDCRFIGNHLYNQNSNNASWGVGLRIIDGNTVIGNRFGGATGVTEYMYYAIDLDGGSPDKNVIVGNYFHGDHQTDLINDLDTATNTIIQGNYGTDQTVTTGSPALWTFGTTSLNSSGGAITGTLGDGPSDGARKIIIMTDDATSSTISIAKHLTSSPEVATFDADGEILILVWSVALDVWITEFATCTF